jgi:hypothetical protein
MSAKSRLATHALRSRRWRVPSRRTDGAQAARSLRRRFGMGLASVGASLGLVALVGGIHAGATSMLLVNTTVDADLETNSSTTCLPACTLRGAVHVANNLGGAVQINVPAGTYTLSMGELQLGTYNAAQSSYAITIQGAGAPNTIIQQGDGSNRVLDLDPTLHGNVDVTIDGVTVSGGHDAHDNVGGAGIISGFQGAGGTNPDHTTVSNCVVTNNHTSSTTATTRPGGGIQNIGGNLTITNCTISNNSSGSSEGGGVYYDSHSPSTGTLAVSGSTFSGNTLANTSGVFLGGAGLKALGPPASQYLISNSVFTNNVASSSASGPVGGGGISSNQGDLQVTRSTFTTNQANGPAATNAGGGAINVSVGGDAAANFFLRLNRIVDNQASSGPSGAYAGAALDFANNWWGCNAGPGNSGCDGASGATTSPRLTLTATASPATIRVNQTSTVTAALKINSAGTDTSVSLGATVQDGVAVGFANGSFGTVSPTSGTLSSATAATTYTAGSTGGADSVPVTIDHQTVGAPITVQQPPHITSANNTTFVAGTLGSFAVTAAGYPPPTFSETGGLPGGVTLASDGTLSGTPATGTGGTYAIVITATNAVTPDDTQSFTLTVDEAAAITSADHATFSTGTAGTFSVTTRGFPTPGLTKAGGLPTGVAFTDNGDGTATIAGTPAAGTGGAYPITITAHNGVGGDAIQSFTLTVDQPPAITSADNATFTVGVLGSFTVTTTSGVPAATTVTEIGTLPSGVSFTDNGDGTATIAGTPGATSAGVYPLTLGASNGVAPDASQDFTLTVGGAPQFTSADNTTFVVGAVGSFSVTTTGSTPMTITHTGTLPSGVSFTDNGDGTATIAGTPAATTGGVYNLTLKAHNGIGSDASQSFTLTIDEAGSITSADHVTFQVATSNTFSVTTVGYPAPSLSESGALPTGVTFTDNGDGTATLAGTPASGTSGNYPLLLTAHNGVGSDGTQNFSLTVGAAQTSTTLTGTTATPNFGQSDTFTATVAPVSPATGTPAGMVTFSVDGTTTTVVTLVSGQASWTTSSLQQGPHSVRASYGGQPNTYQASSGTFAVTVGCGHTITGTRSHGVTITGGSWCITGATISEGLAISGSASVSIVNSIVENGITSSGAKMITLCHDVTREGGFVSISRTKGFVLIGSNRDDAPMPCAANSIRGAVTLRNNIGGIELGANTITGPVSVTSNVMPNGLSVDAENTAPEIEANIINGSLSCSGNSPKPTHDNAPNTVSGTRSGQCGAKGF